MLAVGFAISMLKISYLNSFNHESQYESDGPHQIHLDDIGGRQSTVPKKMPVTGTFSHNS